MWAGGNFEFGLRCTRVHKIIKALEMICEEKIVLFEQDTSKNNFWYKNTVTRLPFTVYAATIKYVVIPLTLAGSPLYFHLLGFPLALLFLLFPSQISQGALAPGDIPGGTAISMAPIHKRGVLLWIPAIAVPHTHEWG